jgi:hypothetical protein
MNRRRFIQTVLGTPFLAPLLVPSEHVSDISELYLLSDHPQSYLCQLLEAIHNFCPPVQQTFSFLNTHPDQKILSRLLMHKGWAPVVYPMPSGMTFSFSRLRRKASPSFSLVKNGKIWDIRTRKLYPLWQSMVRTGSLASLLTVVTFAGKPSSRMRDHAVALFKDGDQIERLPLEGSWTRRIPAKHGSITVRMHDGQAWVAEASCRHKICISAPPVSRAGERIICAPNRFLLEIHGRGVDTVIG